MGKTARQIVSGVDRHFICPRIVLIQARKGTYPEVSVIILGKAPYMVAGYAVGVMSLVHKLAYIPRLIPAIHTVLARGNPQISLGIFKYLIDIFIGYHTL